MNKLFHFSLAAFLAAATVASATIYTTSTQLNSQQYTDLGPGPADVQVTGPFFSSIIVSDTQPQATAVGQQMNAGTPTKTFCQTAHIWALGGAVGSAVNLTPTTCVANSVSVTGRVLAGQIVESCVTPTVTVGNAYGANYVQGGLLTFPNALPLSGGGTIQTVYVNTNAVEDLGWIFTPFSAQPNASTWTDGTAAAITGADKKLVRGPILIMNPSVSISSVFGVHTAVSSAPTGQAINTGSTTLYGVLTTVGALTNRFTTTSDLTVCVDIVQYP